MHGAKNFSFIPKTYILPQEFMYLEEDIKREPNKMWICKPHANSCGRGIIVTNQISEIPQKDKMYVCCEYIHNPLTFNGYKFDLRIYVALTSVNPLRIYIYDEGLVRFATCKYQSQPSQQGFSKASKFMHLTNFSVNKKNLNFVSNTEDQDDRSSSKWALSNLKKAMKE